MLLFTRKLKTEEDFAPAVILASFQEPLLREQEGFVTWHVQLNAAWASEEINNMLLRLRQFVVLSSLLLLVTYHGRGAVVQGFGVRRIPHASTRGRSRSIITSRGVIVPGSTLELTDPETGCDVVLIGCFHGSKSSAVDVATCLNVKDKATQVVVLELCASRFADLRRDMQRKAERQQQQEQHDEASFATAPWIFRFGAMISKTIEKRGFSAGVAAALLGGVAGMQAALSGLEPGLEFRTAFHEVQTHPTTHDDHDRGHGHGCVLILADQAVDETLYKVGRLPYVARDLWKTCREHGWEASFGRESRALALAIGVAREPPDLPIFQGQYQQQQQLSIWDFCTRSPTAIQDMLRLVVPPMLVLQLMILTFNQEMDGWIQTWPPAVVAALDWETGLQALAEDGARVAIAVLLANGMILAFGYLAVALPASRVILRERDDRLAQGIRDACHVATRKAPNGGRVVAVLGLLHVNGVAQRLLDMDQSTASPTN